MMGQAETFRLCIQGALVGALSLVLAGSAHAPAVDLDALAKSDLETGIALFTEPVMPTWVLVTNSPFDRLKKELRVETDCLAEAMYHEARGEGVEGEKAVAEVVMRRTQLGDRPSTICGVVHQGCQFSFMCDGSRTRPRERGTWTRARQLADRILSGRLRLSDVTGGATAFHAINIEPPTWVDSMLKTAQIGNHVFYRSERDALVRPARVKYQADGSRMVDDLELRPSVASPSATAAPESRSQEIQSNIQTPDAVREGA